MGIYQIPTHHYIITLNAIVYVRLYKFTSWYIIIHVNRRKRPCTTASRRGYVIICIEEQLIIPTRIYYIKTYHSSPLAADVGFFSRIIYEGDGRYYEAATDMQQQHRRFEWERERGASSSPEEIITIPVYFFYLIVRACVCVCGREGGWVMCSPIGNRLYTIFENLRSWGI